MSTSDDEVRPSVSTWEILQTHGFVPDDELISEGGLGLKLDFDYGQICAVVGINLRFAPVVSITGFVRTSRTFSLIESDMPRRVESVEQCGAFMAAFLERRLDKESQWLSLPGWIQDGRSQRHLLPWERDRVVYQTRPHCYAERDWARLALRSLAAHVASVDSDSPVVFGFEGSILTIRAGETLVAALPARGEPWQTEFSISAGMLSSLPKRLMHSSVEFSVWNHRLVIAGWRYEGMAVVDAEDANGLGRTPGSPQQAAGG